METRHSHHKVSWGDISYCPEIPQKWEDLTSPSPQSKDFKPFRFQQSEISTYTFSDFEVHVKVSDIERVLTVDEQENVKCSPKRSVFEYLNLKWFLKITDEQQNETIHKCSAFKISDDTICLICNNIEVELSGRVEYSICYKSSDGYTFICERFVDKEEVEIEIEDKKHNEQDEDESDDKDDSEKEDKEEDEQDEDESDDKDEDDDEDDDDSDDDEEFEYYFLSSGCFISTDSMSAVTVQISYSSTQFH